MGSVADDCFPASDLLSDSFEASFLKFTNVCLICFSVVVVLWFKVSSIS